MPLGLGGVANIDERAALISPTPAEPGGASGDVPRPLHQRAFDLIRRPGRMLDRAGRPPRPRPELVNEVPERRM